jgi:hypothetical protein
MNGLFSTWYFRAGVVAGLGFLAYRFLPVPAVGKTAIVALTAFGVAGAVASGVPMVGNVLQGRLPLPQAASTT